MVHTALSHVPVACCCCDALKQLKNDCQRTILVLRLLSAMGIMYVLEQPCHGSTGGLESLRRFQELISDLVAPVLSMYPVESYW